MSYSFILMLASTAVWMVRNQSLYEMWWLFTSLMRYPKEIFTGKLGMPVGLVFTFLIPVLLVSNVPARALAKTLEPWLAAYMVLATVVLVALSRWVFRPGDAELSEREQLKRRCQNAYRSADSASRLNLGYAASATDPVRAADNGLNAFKISICPTSRSMTGSG